MKTINLLLCALFIAFAGNAKNQSKSATININATVPSGTDKVWIVGDFVNWDITKAIEGTKNTDGTFSFSIPATNSIEYRLYNLNDWNFPEVGENNPTIELPNRKANYLADSNSNITVWGWKQTGINPQIKSTYPIIFVHGLNSDNYAWQSNNYLEDLPQILNLHGLVYGGDLNVTLDYDRSSLMNTKENDVRLFENGVISGDYYKINFKTRYDGTHVVEDKPNDHLAQPLNIFETDYNFKVQNPNRYRVGDILCVDNEYMIVESIVDAFINVSRGKFGSQITSHSFTSTIWNLSLESNQASIAKQGWGLKSAIDLVKNKTKSKKVILVGHSMGGLAIREYLRSSYYSKDVAKVVTIGTPHLGSTVAEVNNAITGLVGIDGKSDAIRDLSYNYDNNLNANYLGEDPMPPYGDSPDNGCFLFGGNESNIPKDFHNADVNANGAIDMSIISGININSNTNFPLGISYTWIVSQWGNTVNGDGCVRLNRQFPWFKKENGSPLIEVGDTIKTNKFHTDEPTDYYSLLRGLDEPSTPELAYEIGCNNDITGYITLQKENLNLDVDLYKICLLSEGFLNVSLNASNLSGVKGIAILDSNQQILFTTSTTDFPVNFTYHTMPGTYYIRVRGLATTDSYKYPYTLSTNYYSKLKLKYPVGSESLNVGSTVSIQWENSNLISNIKIEYSTNAGTDWKIITSSFPTTSGSYSWLVPSEISTNCKIRITDTSNQVISDESDNVFSIVDLRPNGITTTLPSAITATTAISGGNIISDGGATITARGVCWNTTGNPIKDDNKTIDGAGIGSFISNLTNLIGNTTYYLKAYATNNAGTAYGNEVQFKTNEAYSWSTSSLINTVISSATGNQTSHQIIKDGKAGAIITWVDSRSGNNDIYAQCINSNGLVQWDTNGVSICNDSYNQNSPQIISDDNGGAIITWAESPHYSGRGSILAQRISSTGTMLWKLNGVIVSSAYYNSYSASSPRIVSDGNGGAIIAYAVPLNAGYAIYLQKINSNGVNQWGSNGVKINGNNYDLKIVSDGDGGAIVTWDDGSYYHKIYSQRINKDGVIVWNLDGVLIGYGSTPNIASDGSGGAIITWAGLGSYCEIYAQRINLYGIAQWRNDVMGGVQLSSGFGGAKSPQISSDANGGAIITWEANFRQDYNIYAERVNSLGNAQWNSWYGIEVCASIGDQNSPQLEVDKCGRSIITWIDNKNGNKDIYAQRVNLNGTKQWSSSGVPICTNTNEQNSPMIVNDDNNGAIISWVDNRNSTSDIFCSKINSSGVLGGNNISLNDLPPDIAGSISGQENVCQGQNNVTYTVPSISGATSYIWSLPSGATGSSSSNTINVNFSLNAISGKITVKGHNNCCDGKVSSLPIQINKTTTPVITLNNNILHSDAIYGNQWYNQNGLINGATDQDYIVTSNGDYYVINTLSGCSSEKSNTINILSTSINQVVLNNSINIYPNPVSNQFIIEINGNTDKKEIKISNSLGQIVYVGSVYEKEVVSIKDFPKGIYLIRIGNDKSFEIKKVLKN